MHEPVRLSGPTGSPNSAAMSSDPEGFPGTMSSSTDPAAVRDTQPAAAETHPPAEGREDAAPTPEAAPNGSDALMQAATARIGELEAALEEMRDKWMRSEAEIQNVRTRSRREVEDARQFAVQKFARDVVEAAENLRRGLSSVPAGDDPLLGKLREGFESVERSFTSILERNGVTGTDPTGALFDANLHQAMAEQPTADHPPGTVIQSWSAAWTLNGRLLKPAMVVVAKAPPEAAPAPAATDAADPAAVAPADAEAPARAVPNFDRTV
jgi:molecular chaperone GrpE